MELLVTLILIIIFCIGLISFISSISSPREENFEEMEIEKIDNQPKKEIIKPLRKIIKSFIVKIKNKRPNEVYFMTAILYFLLFILNSRELYSSKIDFNNLIKYKDSIVFRLFLGDNNDYFDKPEATILYIITTLTFLGVSIIKSKKISKWFWNE
jgi:hypothetical protein